MLSPLRVGSLFTLCFWSISTLAAITPPTLDSEYDIIFAGGGTTASIIAGQLSSNAPDLKILILEAGPTTRERIEHIQPGRYFTHMEPFSNTEQFTASKPSDYVAGRSVVIPSGRCVGGGSSVNFMLYNRPSASDFDDWVTEFGNSGWSSEDLIPLLEMSETYEVNPQGNNHGSSGPLHVSFGGKSFELAQEFLDIGPQVEKNRPLSDEGNDFTEASLNVDWVRWTSLRRCGSISASKHHYLYPQENNSNLVISTGSRVVRLVLSEENEGITATGVEFIYDKHVFPDYPTTTQSITAKKMVILSAGAMGTPLILERSGIGAQEVLHQANIHQVVDLPGVGSSYQGIELLLTPYTTDTETFDPLFRNNATIWAEALRQWDIDRTGFMAANGVDAAIKIRPTEAELQEIGIEFTERWNDFYANKPDKPLFWLSALAGLPADQSGLPILNFMSGGCFLGYPESMGSLHVSSDDPYAPPNFDTGFLSKQSDVAALRWGYKKGREILRRMPGFRGAFVPAHPQFPEGSSAALNETGPVSLDAPNVVYSPEDDEAIDIYIRKFVGTSWHSLGTAPMKALKEGGVVDDQLNVYGVKALKIADLSIPPSNLNANMYSTTIAIAQKAYLIIAKELRIIV
ncbi:alcohol oxidase [Dendrothele bispora CBS 962.96]|uniref:Alcohol oxidase n=1 Tax=Dendrothele bispora (strain CBS 962.96) TaxID=1314807 RepID=A0A4S8MAF2_DENBC|nr:alcohol oxidase [Dendrothele bispora CBS 962.96]